MKTIFDKIKIPFNDQQRKAIKHLEGPAIVLAVAGAGKTTTICTRVGKLIYDKKVDPKKIITLTFSKAAAKDMEKKYTELFGETFNQRELSSPKFSTIHAFAYHILMNHSKVSGINFELIENKEHPNNKTKIISNLFKKYNRDYITEDEIESIFNLFGYAKNKMMTTKEIKNSLKIEGLSYDKIYEEYEDIKRKNNYIDFDDMLILAYEALMENQSLYDFYSNAYDFWQVDEFQDTSLIQYKIISFLTSKHGNLVCVGDDDQSIYGFRGAEPELLLNFKSEYPSAKRFYIEENFRSTKEVVSLAGNIILNNHNRYDKKIFTNNPEGLPSLKKEYVSQRKQADEVLEKSYNKAEKGESVGILYRNNFSSISLVLKLLKDNKDFHVKDFKVSLFTHWITKDIVSLIKLSEGFSDVESFKNIYYKANLYISKEAVTKMEKEIKKTENILEYFLRTRSIEPYKLGKLYDFHKALKDLDKKTIRTAFLDMVSRTNYMSYLNSQKRTSREFVLIMIESIKLVMKECKNLGEFESKLKEIQKEMEKKSIKKGQKIQLSTIHSSKGLEYDNVYLIDVNKSLFPSFDTIQEKNQGNYNPMEEERRLFYVGITRAKKELEISFIKDENNKVSEFIKEVDLAKSLQEIKLKEKELKGKVPLKTDPKMNDLVFHPKFKNGKIKDVRDTIILVDFEKTGLKKLSKENVFKHNLLYSEDV